MKGARLTASLLLLELLACAGDLLLGPFGRVHWEERFNARAGLQLACGHWEALTDLQYVAFCGGCTGEALMGVPLFGLLWPTTLVWKLVPLAFHAVVLAMGAWLATRAAGARAGAAFVALLAAAPGYYRELVLTGWGNHVESAAFPLTAAVLLVLAAGRGPVQRAGLVGAAGAIAGLGAWFCHTSTWALPGLFLGALWVAPLASPLFIAAAWAGFQPWRLYFGERPDQAEGVVNWALNLRLAPAGAWVDWLWGPYLRWGLWDPSDHGAGTHLRGAWWFLFWGLGLLGLAGSLRRRGPKPARLAAAFAPVGLAALLVAYAMRYDLWSHLPEVPSKPTLGLRYRAPLVPLLALGVAATTRQRRPLPALGLLLLVGFGLSRRLALWERPRTELSGLRVYAHDGWRDRSVPLGQPPQRLARKQGRHQDVEAGLAFVEGHRDPFPDCRADHLFELGRRMGLAVVEGGPAAVAERWSRLGPLVEDEGQERLFADGMASVLVEPEGGGLPGMALLIGDLPTPWGPALGRAAGRRVAAQVAGSEAPAIQAGICEARAGFALDAGAALAPACPDPAAWAWGLGFAWARSRGCGGADAAELSTLGGAPATAGWSVGCALLRIP